MGKNNKKEWTLNDYYNHYLNTKRFGFIVPIQFKGETHNNEFGEVNKRLNDYFERFSFIYERLNDLDRVELKHDFLDQLKRLKTRQTHSKFQILIDDLIKKIEVSTKRKENRVTELQKSEIDKKYFPNGLPYVVETFNTESYSKRLNEPFEDVTEYENAVKNIIHSNGLRFYHFIKGMNEAEFIKEIENQFLNFTIENLEYVDYWLKLTYDLVLKGFSVNGKIENPNLRGAFIKWYNSKIKELNIQEIQETKTETQKPDEVKKEMYNHIFKGNAFDVWQYMFEEFEITEQSRTDVKFMFEEMKKAGLIHDTVNQVDFLAWIPTAYNGLIIEKTSNYNRTPNRIKTFSRAEKLFKREG